MAVTLTHTSVEHVLAKYSSKHTKGDGSQADWAHWSSPTLLISLTVSSTADGNVNAARLLVIWHRDPDGPEIMLEELDLLQFSTITAPTPLRAVYNNALVGIRYIHPLHQTPNIFNQIQVRFLNASDALNFVSHLNRFCPCKEEPARPNPLRTMRPPTVAAQRHTIISKAPLSTATGSTRLSTLSSTHTSSSPAAIPPSSASSFIGAQTSGLLTSGLPMSADSATHVPVWNTLDIPTADVFESSSSLKPQVSVPTGPASTLEPPPVAKSAESIVAAVRDVPELYQLTTPDLETEIAKIIREPGFLEFLGRVEAMWRVRGLVGR